MMTATAGLATILVTLLFGRVVKIGTRLRPIPWWLTDNMIANIVTPAVVTSLVVGIGILISSVVRHGWEVLGLLSLAGMAASVAGFVLCWRLLTAWSLRVDAALAPAAAPVAPAAAQNDADQPPGVPPLKKAA